MTDKNLKLNEVLLTTFPSHKSQNIGDNLICQSALKLVKKKYPNYNPDTKFREVSLDGYSRKRIQHILAPGFSVSNNVYPDLFALYTDIKRLKYFYPIGCSYQHPIPARSSFFDAEYNEQTLLFLKYLCDKFGPFPCRDMLIVEMLNDKLNIPAYYSGDLALYDELTIGSPFLPPTEIKSVLFTIQHHLRYKEQY